MNASTAWSLLAVGLGGAALGVALAGDAAPPSCDGSAAAVSASPATDAVTRDELDALRDELRRLGTRLDRLDDLVTSREPLSAAGSADEQLEELREEVRALRERTAAALPADAGPRDLREQVASALSEIRHEERVDSVRSKLDARAEQLDDAMPKFEEWLGLDPGQSASMRDVLLAQYAREEELVRRWEAGEDAAALGEQKDADRALHDAEMSAILTADQLETYRARVGGGGK